MQLAAERREAAVAGHEHEGRERRARVREIERVDHQLDVGGVLLRGAVVGEDLPRLDPVLGHLTPQRAHEAEAPVAVRAADGEVADQARSVAAQLGHDVAEREPHRGLLPPRRIAEEVLDVEENHGVVGRHARLSLRHRDEAYASSYLARPRSVLVEHVDGFAHVREEVGEAPRAVAKEPSGRTGSQLAWRKSTRPVSQVSDRPRVPRRATRRAPFEPSLGRDRLVRRLASDGERLASASSRLPMAAGRPIASLRAPGVSPPRRVRRLTTPRARNRPGVIVVVPRPRGSLGAMLPSSDGALMRSTPDAPARNRPSPRRDDRVRRVSSRRECCEPGRRHVPGVADDQGQGAEHLGLRAELAAAAPIDGVAMPRAGRSDRPTRGCRRSTASPRR